MTTTHPTLPTEDPSLSSSSQDILQRWVALLRQRFSRATGRMLARFFTVAGLLGSTYVLGWGEVPVHASWASYLQFLFFPLLALGLAWFRVTQEDLRVYTQRWDMLIPWACFAGTFRHVSHSWLLTVVLCLCILLGRYFLDLHAPTKTTLLVKLRNLAWNTVFLLIFVTHCFLPRTIFASLVVFVPFALLVIFYNFILERDRLRRAKALSVGTPPLWLRQANRLIPSSTYLFLLLPGLLFAEAFLFHAVYQHTHKPTLHKTAPALSKDPYRQPHLRDWLTFAVTVKMHATPLPEIRLPAEVIPHVYRELPGGYLLTAGLIRGLLIFFYAKRIVLIFLLLMEANLGLRVHRMGILEQVEGAESRLHEVRQVLLRTLDSYPRVWAGLFLRGIQGKHAVLDPFRGLQYTLQWIRSQLLPRIIPWVSNIQSPQEPMWSRWIREEQIALFGKMQDRTWVLESFIDLLRPEDSNTWRGTIYRYTQIPLLRPLGHLYMAQPETEVQARMIAELASIIEHAVDSRQSQIVLSDIDIDLLTPDQVWILRDRVLQILERLTQSQERAIRIAAIRAITRIAALDRPVGISSEIWSQCSQSLSLALEKNLTEETTASPFSTHTPATNTFPSQPTSTAPIPDPFHHFLQVDAPMERRVLFEALGTLGVEHAAMFLTQQTQQVDKQELPFVISCLGRAGKASGHPQAGFAVLEKHLTHLYNTLPPHSPSWYAVLDALLELAFPSPLAQAFHQQKLCKHRQQLCYQNLVAIQQTLQQQETAQQASPTEERRDLLWQTYQQQQTALLEYEKQTQILLQHIQDTFWIALHYGAGILLALYNESEGFTHSPEFTEHLTRLSLEDPQGWRDFLSYLPDHLDPNSNYVSLVQFCSRIAEIQHDVFSEQSLFVQFLEYKTNQVSIERNTAQLSWDKQQRLQEAESKLYEALTHWIPCLRFRSTLFLCFSASDSASSVALSDGSEQAVETEVTALPSSSWWSITWTGLSPWIQKLSDTPFHVQPGVLYLRYEQFSPLSLHPMNQISWLLSPEQEQLKHGNIPKARYWSLNYHRFPHLHLRQLYPPQDQGYWRAPEKLDTSQRWQEIQQHLAGLREHRLISHMDLAYIRTRSQANVQRVFARSRLREQDALMIVRDAIHKLDHFIQQPYAKESDIPTPTVFFMAGDAGVGHTTLLLQHARQQAQHAKHTPSPPPLVFFLDMAQLEEHEHFVAWLLHELQTKLTSADRREIHKQPNLWFQRWLQVIEPLSESPITTILYIDGFHEKPDTGMIWLGQILQLAQEFHRPHPWLRFVLSTRRSYVEMNLEHQALSPFVEQHRFTPPAHLCYREKASIHGVLIPLSTFAYDLSTLTDTSRSELKRAYAKYYHFTDTRGTPRYRPLLERWDNLDPFGLTFRLLSYPALLPVIMETFHQKELPSDLHLLEFLGSYFHQFTEAEQQFLRQCTRLMLFGAEQVSTPRAQPALWNSDVTLPESMLWQHPMFLPYVGAWIEGVSPYDNLRSRGILIRQWRTAPHHDSGSNSSTSVPQRHVTFTSHQLFEYLVFRELLHLVPTRSPQETNQTTPPEWLEWLLALANHAGQFRPMEGALLLLLLYLLEHQHYRYLADFNDASNERGIHSYHWLEGALAHLPPQVLTRWDGPLPVIFQAITENDLWLAKQLGQQWHRQGLYAQVDALYGLLLDSSAIFEQLQKFPIHLTDLFLARASNRRQLLAQQSGGLLSDALYQEGRNLYQHTLQRMKPYHPSQMVQAKILRYQAWFEMDTNHLDHAIQSLQQAWLLICDARGSESILEESWIRHLQSAVLRRAWETQTEDPVLWEKQKDAFRVHVPMLQQAKDWGEEALLLLEHEQSEDRIDLLTQVYDNIARIYIHMAEEDPTREHKATWLHLAIENFRSSLRVKQIYHDFLGQAISQSGLGEAYLQRALLYRNEHGSPEEKDWQLARTCFQQALYLNQEQLGSEFGTALSHHALASLYLTHPAHHADGVSALVEALLAFGRIHHTPGSQRAMTQMVQELATLPTHDMMRVLKSVTESWKKAEPYPSWLLQSLWEQLHSTFGENIPRPLQDWWNTQSIPWLTQPKTDTQKGEFL